jgi:hypothetical protein
MPGWASPVAKNGIIGHDDCYAMNSSPKNTEKASMHAPLSLDQQVANIPLRDIEHGIDAILKTINMKPRSIVSKLLLRFKLLGLILVALVSVAAHRRGITSPITLTYASTLAFVIYSIIELSVAQKAIQRNLIAYRPKLLSILQNITSQGLDSSQTIRAANEDPESTNPGKSTKSTANNSFPPRLQESSTSHSPNHDLWSPRDYSCSDGSSLGPNIQSSESIHTLNKASDLDKTNPSDNPPVQESSPSFICKISHHNTLIIKSVYTHMLDLIPGDEFYIEIVGGRIILKPMGADSLYESSIPKELRIFIDAKNKITIPEFVLRKANASMTGSYEIKLGRDRLVLEPMTKLHIEA